jgi:hypothetical protein
MNYHSNAEFGIGHNSGPAEHGLDDEGVRALEQAARELVPWPLDVSMEDALSVKGMPPYKRAIAQRNASLRQIILLARKGGDISAAIVALVSALSDNEHGRSNISLARIARVLKRKDDRQVERCVRELVSAGVLCRENVGANNAVMWVPLTTRDLAHKPTDLVEALAPKIARGRPKNTPARETGVIGENPRYVEPGYYENTPVSHTGVKRNTPVADTGVMENTPVASSNYRIENTKEPSSITTNLVSKNTTNTVGEEGNVAAIGTELVPMSFGTPDRAGQLQLGDDADASGLASKACRKLGISEDDARAVTIAGSVRNALDRWNDTKPDARGYRRGCKSFDVYFWTKWFAGVSEDIRKLDARREITDRQISADRAAAERSLPAPDDGLGAWRYSRNTKPRWLESRRQHVEFGTLNRWLAEADERYGTQIARTCDLDELLARIEPDDDVADLVLQAAIERVHGYRGGAVQVDHGVTDAILREHPNVPREFAGAHVEGCFARPKAVGMRPRKFNGAGWLSDLAKATVDHFGIVLADARQRASDQLSNGWHSMASEFARRWGDLPREDVETICSAAWRAACGDSTEPQDPFAPSPEWTAMAFANAKVRLIERLEQLRERGPEKPTHSGSERWHRQSCDRALEHVRGLEWTYTPHPLKPLQLKAPGDLPSIDSGGWEF